MEISFATVYVSFLGQVLWRRSLIKSRRGVTLAEMDMRSWVMQPGTMLTHFNTMRSASLSLLGVLTLIAAIVALLYTTASEALVQPQLKFGKPDYQTLKGLVKTSWSNAAYVQSTCASPTKASDKLDGPTTCTEIEYAAQAYHNYHRFISDWETRIENGNTSMFLDQRPQPFALLTENTTVTGQWIEMTANNATTLDGRVVNNVSMAMPHAGVTTAARDPINGILQPEVSQSMAVKFSHLTFVGS